VFRRLRGHCLDHVAPAPRRTAKVQVNLNAFQRVVLIACPALRGPCYRIKISFGSKLIERLRRSAKWTVLPLPSKGVEAVDVNTAIAFLYCVNHLIGHFDIKVVIIASSTDRLNSSVRRFRGNSWNHVSSTSRRTSKVNMNVNTCGRLILVACPSFDWIEVHWIKVSSGGKVVLGILQPCFSRVGTSTSCFVIIVARWRVSYKRFENSLLGVAWDPILELQAMDIGRQIIVLPVAVAWVDAFAGVKVKFVICNIIQRCGNTATSPIKVDLKNCSRCHFSTISTGDGWHVFNASAHWNFGGVNHVLNISTAVHMVVKRNIKEVIELQFCWGIIFVIRPC